MATLDEHVSPALSHLQSGGVYRCASPHMGGATYTARLDAASEVIVVVGKNAEGEVFSSAAAPNFSQFLQMADQYHELSGWIAE